MAPGENGAAKSVSSREKLSLALGMEEFPGQVPEQLSSGKSSRKELGAYYTDAAVAGFLVRWAVVAGTETVLDPSCGEGVFLAAAAERINSLGGDPARQVYGVEIDEVAHRRVASRSRTGVPQAALLHADFFQLRPGELPAVDAVVGNPPFIRTNVSAAMCGRWR